MNIEHIQGLWRTHQDAPFPSDVVGVEIEGEDMVSLDSFTAGCISSFTGNRGSLSTEKTGVLVGCSRTLALVLPHLSGETRIYYDRLHQMSRLALENLKSAEEIARLVEEETVAILDPDLKARCTPLLRPPEMKRLVWEYGDDEEFDGWLVADMGERNVWAVYCEGGHRALGHPWGIIFKDGENFGMDSGWYRSLHELFSEWFA